MRLERRVPFDRAGFGTAMRNVVDNVCRHCPEEPERLEA
jgi:hypothetical protein